MPITITEVERQKRGPIYALNSSKPPLRGTLVIPIDDRKDQLVLPMTWVPMDLNEFAEKSKFLNSTQFRQQVMQGNVTLLSEKEALAILGKEGASTELARARQFRIGTVPTAKDPMEMAASVPKNDPATDLSPPVFSLIETMASNDEIEVLNTLRNMGTVKRKEYKAIYKRAKELGMKKLKAYCKEQKAALSA